MYSKQSILIISRKVGISFWCSLIIDKLGLSICNNASFCLFIKLLALIRDSENYFYRKSAKRVELHLHLLQWRTAHLHIHPSLHYMVGDSRGQCFGVVSRCTEVRGRTTFWSFWQMPSSICSLNTLPGSRMKEVGRCHKDIVSRLIFLDGKEKLGCLDKFRFLIQKENLDHFFFPSWPLPGW